MTASLSTTPKELNQSRRYALFDMAYEAAGIRKFTIGTNGPSTPGANGNNTKWRRRR